MKKILLIVFILVAQLGAAQDYASMMKFKINGKITFGDNKNQVITLLGQPNKETTEFNEMDEVDMLVLHYGKSMVYLENNKVTSFEIKDSSLYLTYDQLTMRIGDHIDILKRTFPESYSKGKNRPAHPHLGSSVHLVLKMRIDTVVEEPIEEYVSKFNSQTLRITLMRHGSY